MNVFDLSGEWGFIAQLRTFTPFDDVKRCLITFELVNSRIDFAERLYRVQSKIYVYTRVDREFGVKGSELCERMTQVFWATSIPAATLAAFSDAGVRQEIDPSKNTEPPLELIGGAAESWKYGDMINSANEHKIAITETGSYDARGDFLFKVVNIPFRLAYYYSRKRIRNELPLAVQFLIP